MIALSGRAERFGAVSASERTVWRLTSSAVGPTQGRAYLAQGDADSLPNGFGLYVFKTPPEERLAVRDWVQVPPSLSYVQPDDVISYTLGTDRVRVLWRFKGRQNGVLLTERCNHYCLMCSQPPRNVDDDWHMTETMELVRLLPRSAGELIFTGGEPTLYGQKLIELLRLCHSLLPETDIHVLTNGVAFADDAFAQSWASIGHPGLMAGIPLYGAEPTTHDYVVQSPGAFDKTVRGILNLAQLGQRIEIRVVIHGQTAPQLTQLAEFIARNLPFVEQVVLMGLEVTGLTLANLESVWIDPYDYRDELADAAMLLHRRGVRTKIYNHQLCLIDRDLWPLTVKSISDWKNSYIEECEGCAVRDQCGGFFETSRGRVSQHVKRVTAA